ILITHIFFSAVCIAQTEKIDRLKKSLPALNDSSRIDCLNELSEEYVGIQKDTAQIFVLQALKEAEKINYVHGLAEGISLKATLAFEKDNIYPTAENFAREAILLYAKTPNKKKLNRTYYELGHALYAQSDF